MNLAAIEHEKNIKYLYEILSKYIKKRKKEGGVDYVANELYLHIWQSNPNKTNKNKEIRIKKLIYLMKNLLEDSKFFHERLDFLCFFVKILELVNDSKIPKESLYTRSDVFTYDPAKNAANIIKHSDIDETDYFNGPSFPEVMSYGIGNKIICMDYKNENRCIALHKVNRDNEERVALVFFTTSGEIRGYRVFGVRFLGDKDKIKQIEEEAIKDGNLNKEENKNFREFIIKEYLADELDNIK